MNAIWQAWRYYKKHAFVLIFCSVLGFIGIFFNQLIPQAIQLILDKVILPAVGQKTETESSSIFLPLVKKIIGNDLSANLTLTLTALVAIIFVLLISRYIAHYLRWNLGHGKSVDSERLMRNDVFKKMITQNTAILNRYTSGELLSIAQSDVVMIKDMFLHYIPFTIEAFVWVIFAVYFITRIHWSLAILPLLIGVAMGITSQAFMQKMRTIFNNIRNKTIDLNSCVQENINGIRIVKAYAAEEQEISKFDKVNENYKESYFEHTNVWSKYNAIYSSFTQIAYIGSIIIAIFLGLKGILTIGEFSSFVAYIGLITGPLMGFSNNLGQLQQSIICAQRVFTFLNTSNIITDVSNAKAITDKPNLSINNADLVIDGHNILKNISLELPYGKKLGIMGKTGSGKSALLKLMARFMETTKGEIVINGTNIKNLKLEDVRRQFGYVMQNVFLFSNTIDSNIAFYDPDISHEEVVKAAKIAQADKFITEMPQGYETIVGEYGIGLSGGQRQRVSIARALLKKAPILMLDDATSALDLETERKIIQNLNRDYPDKSIVISAHRAASVEFCDEIIYLEDGKIIERGTHNELMAQNGRYAEVYKKQQAVYEGIL